MLKPFLFYIFIPMVVEKGEVIALIPVLAMQKLTLTEDYLSCIEVTISIN